MKAVKEIILKIELDQEEAIWLYKALNRPLDGKSLEEEDQESRETRENIYGCLKNAMKSKNRIPKQKNIVYR